jgi:hypothetical protein
VQRLTLDSPQRPFVQFGMSRNRQRLARTIRKASLKLGVAPALSNDCETEFGQYPENIPAGENLKFRHG